MADSFEVTEYGEPTDPQPDFAVVYQIVVEATSKSPSASITPRLMGGILKLTYCCYEMHLPSRLKEVEDLAKTALKEMVSHIKKEYKKKTGKAIALKEKKEMADRNVQKVSLNERYVYTTWKCFDLA